MLVICLSWFHSFTRLPTLVRPLLSIPLFLMNGAERVGGEFTFISRLFFRILNFLFFPFTTTSTGKSFLHCKTGSPQESMLLPDCPAHTSQAVPLLVLLAAAVPHRCSLFQPSVQDNSLRVISAVPIWDRHAPLPVFTMSLF